MCDSWDARRLMGLNEDENAEAVANTGKGVAADPGLWGQPGHMSMVEAKTFASFRDEVQKRGGEFRETVYSFGEEEGETYALGRWLRARKFVLADVIKMVEEATECRKAAKEKNFYPNPVEVLGVEPAIFFAQYPQVYSGVAKNGCPVFISKPGLLNVDAVECITTLEGIIQFHWYVMMHDFAKRLREEKAKNPEGFTRFECVCILDLAHLKPSKVNRRALAIIKEQTTIDSLCFPETMNKMFLVNAPPFFAGFWRMIKGWLDARTANKVHVNSSRASWVKKLLEVVDEDQLPSDYGGKGPDTNDTIMKSLSVEGCADRMFTKLVHLRGSEAVAVEIPQGESLEVTVFTRSTSGAAFSILDPKSKKNILEGVEVKHNGTSETEMPTSVILNKEARIHGPRTCKVRVNGHGSRLSVHNYLVVFSFYKDAH